MTLVPDALAAVHDVALLDLDGVVYAGSDAVPHAVAALSEAGAAGMRLAFVTNNASRTPQTVAAHLRELGVPAEATDVVTSAQAGAGLVAGLVPPGSAVLAVGGPGLREALADRGLRPVVSADDAPAAVIQGFDPGVGWPLLAEAAYVLARGVPWVATNTDLTIPTGRGTAPGNGTLVQVLALTTGRAPVVAGKPEPPLMLESVARTRAATPLAIGDRLDTDIEGAVRTGIPSLLVLTGVTDAAALVAAPPTQRPTYVADDLRGLLVPGQPARLTADGEVTCGGWRVAVRDGRVVVHAAGTAQAQGVHAVAAAGWAEYDAGRPFDAAASLAALPPG